MLPWAQNKEAKVRNACLVKQNDGKRSCHSSQNVKCENIVVIVISTETKQKQPLILTVMSITTTRNTVKSKKKRWYFVRVLLENGKTFSKKKQLT